jgi:hypothetical protein
VRLELPVKVIQAVMAILPLPIVEVEVEVLEQRVMLA